MMPVLILQGQIQVSALLLNSLFTLNNPTWPEIALPAACERAPGLVLGSGIAPGAGGGNRH